MKKIFFIAICSFGLIFADDFKIGHDAFLAKDYEKAYQFWKKDCQNNSAKSCSGLGFLYLHGKSVKTDLKEALRLYKKSCELNNGRACYNIGAFYGNGMGVKKDENLAREYFLKGCDLGSKFSCEAYKIINRNQI